MNNYEIHNLEELKKLAEEIAKNIQTPYSIYLNGNLGAGKTTFTQFLLRELGVEENITSPTFTFLKNYTVDSLNIYHYDFYRIDDSSDDNHKQNLLEQIQFFENLNDKNGVVIVEWSVNATKFLPQPTLSITINVNGDFRELQLNYNN